MLDKEIEYYIHEFNKLMRRRKTAEAKGKWPGHATEALKLQAASAYGCLLKFIIKNSRFPTVSQISEFVSSNSLNRAIGSIADAKKILIDNFAEIQGILLEEGSLPEEAVSSNYSFSPGSYIITGSIMNSPVNRPFLKSLNKFCEVHDSQLLILPIRSPQNSSFSNLQKEIFLDTNGIIIDEELRLGKYFHVSPLKISAKYLEPCKGAIKRLTNKKGSFIFGSPKQHLRVVPQTRQGSIPNVIMTSGVINNPDYLSSKYTEQRLSAIAEADHITGAILVDIDDRGFFNFRQIQALRDGSFIDLGVKYSEKGLKKVETKGFVVGDTHVGEHDKEVTEQNKELVKELEVSTLFFHDLFSGKSINPHEKDKIITRVRTKNYHTTSLQEEFKWVKQYLKDWDGYASEMAIVDSNHHRFLIDYLESGRWIKDPENFMEAHRLVKFLVNRTDRNAPVLEEAVGEILSNSSIRWLGPNEDYIIDGVQMGAHGHLGPSGSRGTLGNLEGVYGNYFGAHTHVPAILRGGWTVGMSCKAEADYKEGPDSWIACSGSIFEEGARQLYLFIHENSAKDLIAIRKRALEQI